MDLVNIDAFKKIELKVGKVLVAEEVEGSDKLIRLEIDLNEEKPRQVLTGMKMWHKPEYFLGKQVTIISNLEPRKMMGFESQGMIIAVDGAEGQPILLVPEDQVPDGSSIR